MSTIQGMYVHILQFHYQNKYLKTFYMQYGEYLIIVFSAMVHHDISMTSTLDCSPNITVLLCFGVGEGIRQNISIYPNL